MFYLVKSNTKSMKDKIVQKIIKENDVSSEDIFVFDYEESKTVEPAFLEYLTLDFEKRTKAIIIKHADFINSARVDQQLENRFASAALLSNNNILIMLVDKLNKTGALRKRFEKEMNIIEMDAPSSSDRRKFISDFFENRGIKIASSEIELIKTRTSDDFDLLVSELTKLEILQSQGVITKEHIEKGTLDFSRERLYKIAEYVITLNEVKVMEMMKQYRAEGEGPYLIGEFMVKDFSKLLRYKLMIDKGFTDNQIKDMTGWNPWALKNYSRWIYNWKDVNHLKEFFYDTILDKCFFSLINNQPEDPIGSLEKVLVANIIGAKEKNKQNR